MQCALIVLAAGKGTRMQSDLPKVLHPLAGAPLLAHAIESGSQIQAKETVVVVGHGAEQVQDTLATFAPKAYTVIQSEQLGTGHAVAQAKSILNGFDGDVFVLYGDTPLIEPETLSAMARARAQYDLVVLGFHAQDPGRYGRLVMRGDVLEKIVEYKDANDQERANTFCNSGVMAAKASVLFSLIEQLSNDNASGEYYLTDVVALAAERGLLSTAIGCDEAQTLGVNSRLELAQAEEIFQDRARTRLMACGVTLQAPKTVYVSKDTKIAPECLVEPNVVFGANVTVESGAHIRAFSHLEGCVVGRDAIVGPYARLRPGSELAQGSKIGNFVEVKNAVIAQGAKVNHLSYIGDCDIGAHANVGAGTVTCNYDGVFKHKSVIGEGAFIGSGTMLVAPVRVGAGALTASGSVIVDDVPDDALAFGRAKQINKPNLAAKLFNMLRSKKACQKKDVS